MQLFWWSWFLPFGRFIVRKFRRPVSHYCIYRMIGLLICWHSHAYTAHHCPGQACPRQSFEEVFDRLPWAKGGHVCSPNYIVMWFTWDAVNTQGSPQLWKALSPNLLGELVQLQSNKKVLQKCDIWEHFCLEHNFSWINVLNTKLPINQWFFWVGNLREYRGNSWEYRGNARTTFFEKLYMFH